jgi:signal transduction histidine kinase
MWQADWALAGIVWLASVVTSTPSLLALDQADAWVVVTALSTGQALSLVWRRRNVPRMALALGLFCVAQLVTISTPLFSDVAVLIALYSAARWTEAARVRYSVLAGAVLLGLVAAFRWVTLVVPTGVLAYFALSAGFIGLAWFAGDVSLRRAKYTAGLEEQNLVLQRERAQANELAAAAERNAIARELHDVLAHSLAVIAVQAEGAAYSARNEQTRTWEPVAATLQTIADTARDSLAETRRVVFQLRDTPAGVTAANTGAATNPSTWTAAPAPDLDDVAALCARLTQAGRPVQLSHAEDLTDLTHEVSRASYRIIQESLTNALKHGSPRSPITVEVSRRGPQVHLVITSTLEPARDQAYEQSPGSGLAGMTERARSVGGHVTAGADSHGRFVVNATLPIRGAS